MFRALVRIPKPERSYDIRFGGFWEECGLGDPDSEPEVRQSSTRPSSWLSTRSRHCEWFQKVSLAISFSLLLLQLVVFLPLLQVWFGLQHQRQPALLRPLGYAMHHFQREWLLTLCRLR